MKFQNSYIHLGTVVITVVLLYHVVVVLTVVPNVVNIVLFGFWTSGHTRNVYITPKNGVV